MCPVSTTWWRSMRLSPEAYQMRLPNLGSSQPPELWAKINLVSWEITQSQVFHYSNRKRTKTTSLSLSDKVIQSTRSRKVRKTFFLSLVGLSVLVQPPLPKTRGSAAGHAACFAPRNESAHFLLCSFPTLSSWHQVDCAEVLFLLEKFRSALSILLILNLLLLSVQPTHKPMGNLSPLQIPAKSSPSTTPQHYHPFLAQAISPHRRQGLLSHPEPYTQLLQAVLFRRGLLFPQPLTPIPTLKV